VTALRRVRPGRYSGGWPVEGLVQVTARTEDSQTLKVYLDGVEVGTLRTYTRTPRVPIRRGSRVGKDLAPRRVWYVEDFSGIKYEQLSDAVRLVLEYLPKTGGNQ